MAKRWFSAVVILLPLVRAWVIPHPDSPSGSSSTLARTAPLKSLSDDEIFTNRAKVWLVEEAVSHSNDCLVEQSELLHPQPSSLEQKYGTRPPSKINQPQHHQDEDTPPSSNIRFTPIDINNDNQPKIPAVVQQLAQTAATATWNWCAHFVARHHLCPWAAASLRDDDSIQLYCWVVGGGGGSDSITRLNEVLVRVALKLMHDFKENTIDPNTAIAFVLLVPFRFSQHETDKDDDASSWYTEFGSFYDVFCDLEEQWSLHEDITLAPFHPEWSYYAAADDDDDPLELEKQSPYPTISLVSTATIDKAGEAATRQIAAQNEQVLQQKSAAEWRRIYRAAVNDASSSSTE